MLWAYEQLQSWAGMSILCIHAVSWHVSLHWPLFFVSVACAEGNKVERAAPHFWCTERDQIVMSLVPLSSLGARFPPRLTSCTPAALDWRVSKEVLVFDLWCCWWLPVANTLPPAGHGKVSVLWGSKSRKDFAWPVVAREGRVSISLGVPDLYLTLAGSIFVLGVNSSCTREKSWANSAESGRVLWLPQRRCK